MAWTSFVHAAAVRVGPADADGGQGILAADILAQAQGVQGRDRMAGADRTGVHVRVDEVLVGDVAILVADEAVGRDDVSLELDLRLRVEGDRLERAGQVLGEQPAGLVEDVDVGVEAVALVGELLEQRVVVVAHPDADRDELDAGRRVAPDRAQDRFRVRQPDIRDAVRGEDDPIDAVLRERAAGEVVAEPQAGLEVRGAAGLQLVDHARG